MPASVTMNGGMSKKWMIAPIAAPKAAHSKRIAAKATSGCMPRRSISQRDEHGGKADHRADRQVDPARNDHEGHAGGDDAEKGVVGQQIGRARGWKRSWETARVQSANPTTKTMAVIANRRQTPSLAGPRPARPAALAKRGDCSSRTISTTAALTTRLNSGGIARQQDAGVHGLDDQRADHRQRPG